MQEEISVMKALLAYQRDFEEIEQRIEGKRSLPCHEVEELQAMLKTLKTRLAHSAKVGTVSGKKQPMNKIENAFFDPAVRKASARFKVRVNSHPIRSHWISGLYESKEDISYMLFELKEAFPRAWAEVEGKCQKAN